MTDERDRQWYEHAQSAGFVFLELSEPLGKGNPPGGWTAPGAKVAGKFASAAAALAWRDEPAREGEGPPRNLAVGTENGGRGIVVDADDRIAVGHVSKLLRDVGFVTLSESTPRGVAWFFTLPAGVELAKLNETMVGTLGANPDDYHFIDPSAGSGCFYNVLPSDRRTGIDIVPHQGLVYQDYLAWRPREGLRCVVVGNPPFGLRGHLALKFINHSAEFADIVGFILPQSFESDGKGAASKRVDSRYAMALSKPLPPASFQYPDGRDVEVATVFQVWTKVGKERITPASRPDVSDYVRVYSLSDGGTPSSTRNKAMLHKCDVYLPSTCYNGMRAYDKFDELPHRRGYGVAVKQRVSEIARLLRSADWESVAFRSTNGALNLRTSLIEGVVAAGGFRR